MRIALFASTERSGTGLEEASENAEVADVLAARTMAEFFPCCRNDRPNFGLLEVDAVGTSVREAVDDLSQMLPMERPIGVSTRRQSERPVGELHGIGMHQAASSPHGEPTSLPHVHIDHAVGKRKGDRLSLQRFSQTVPTREQAELSAGTQRGDDHPSYGDAGPIAAQISDRLGVTSKAIENHGQCVHSNLGVQNQSVAVSAAFLFDTVDHRCAPVRPSGPTLSRA